MFIHSFFSSNLLLFIVLHFLFHSITFFLRAKTTDQGFAKFFYSTTDQTPCCFDTSSLSSFRLQNVAREKPFFGGLNNDCKAEHLIWKAFSGVITSTGVCKLFYERISFFFIWELWIFILNQVQLMQLFWV